MGAGIGQGSVIATKRTGRYDITGIGARNLIPDEVSCRDEDIRRG